MNDRGDRDPGDPDDELSRELRRRVGAEFRADAEEGERLAELARLRGRSLGELAAELRDRGDRVQLVTAGRAFLGTVEDAGQDHCTLRTVAGDVHVALEGRPIHLTVAEPHAVEPPTRRSRAATFRSRVRELEMEGREVEIGATSFAEPLRGRIVAVAGDHLVVDDRVGDRWFVAWSALAYVLAPDGTED